MSSMHRRTFLAGAAASAAVAAAAPYVHAQKRGGTLKFVPHADLKILDTWKLPDCVQPSAVEFDGATSRLLIGCRGDKPSLIDLGESRRRGERRDDDDREKNAQPACTPHVRHASTTLR